ncbi:MAG TPA: hypothetical protein VF469_21180 [Kofleriaceae bacterium]
MARAVATAGATPWLVGYDANGIQELIAACGRPISMRGASEAILAFDAEVRNDERTVFAGGGRGISLARSEGEARAVVRGHVDRYREITRGGVMAACTVPLKRGGDAEAQSIRWLRHRLDIEKDAARPPGGVLPSSKEIECAYCRSYRGTRQRKRDDEIEMVCARCDAMLERGRSAGQQHGRPRGEMSRSIADIAESGRIAVISADGNSLGALFEGLHGLVELAAVSEAVATIFQRAHERALACVPVDQRVPLMTGGDDVRAFIPPSSVLPYVEALVEVVESSAGEHARVLGSVISPEVATRLGELGVGVGAVIANVYYPAWRLVDHAHALERSAKAACYARGWRSGFDFAVVTTEDSMTTEPDRTSATRDIRPLRPRSDAWRDAMRNARALAKIPSAQLGVLAAGRALEDAELGNALRYQVARSSAWQAWYTTCGVDWRVPEVVLERRPDRGSLELARLLAREEARA